MERIQLGTTGIVVPRVGFGCAAMGGFDYGAVDDDESIRAVHHALDIGINFFDTADIYGLGHAEEVLGRALAGRRDQAVVATKVGLRWDQAGIVRRDLSPHWIQEAVDASLRRLRCETIDVYQIHWPDPSVPLAESSAALLRCLEQGKVRSVGCCNFTESLVEELRSLLPAHSLQVSYNVLDRAAEPAMRTALRRHGMAVLSYNSLAQGLFSGRYDLSSTFSKTDHRRRSPYFNSDALPRFMAIVECARSIGRAHGVGPLQVAVRWALDGGPVSCALAGVKHAWQVDELSKIGSFRLNSRELELMSETAAAAASG